MAWYYVRAVDNFNQTSPKSNKKIFWMDGLPEEQKTRVGVGTDEIITKLPDKDELYGNYPNPFNPITHIQYDLSEDGYVTLKAFDVLGREVKTLVDGFQVAGRKSVEFDATKLPSGIYYYQVQAGSFFAMKKMVLIK